jgi:ribosomal RNA-processing protein 8
LIVSQKVHSFDLVSSAPGVIACNMADVPLGDASVDASVFSLALMGTDYGAFLLEAERVTRPGGWLWIAEVRREGGREGGAREGGTCCSSSLKVGKE